MAVDSYCMCDVARHEVRNMEANAAVVCLFTSRLQLALILHVHILTILIVAYAEVNKSKMFMHAWVLRVDRYIFLFSLEINVKTILCHRVMNET